MIRHSQFWAGYISRERASSTITAGRLVSCWGGQDCVEEQMFFNMSCCSLWSSSLWPDWRSSFSGQVLKAPEFFLGPWALDVSRYFEPFWTNAAVLAGPPPLAHLHAVL
ncbi:unnamed protein product [Boreogadus saida]